MSKSSILYSGDEEEEEEQEQEETTLDDETLGALGEEDSPFKNGDAKKCYSVVKPEIKEKSSNSTYKKNPLGTSRRDLIGKFEKELQCQYCERPYRQRHHLLAHESKTCPVVLQMARDKLMNQVATTCLEKKPIGKVVVLTGETPLEMPLEKPLKKKKAFNPPPPPQDYPRQREKRKKVIVYKDVSESSEDDETLSTLGQVVEPVIIKPKFKFGGR